MSGSETALRDLTKNPSKLWLKLSADQRQECLNLDRCLWAQESIQRVDNNVFTLTNRQYLVDIYQDESPTIAIQKVTQIGITTWGLAGLTHDTGLRGRNTIYYFPNDNAIGDFVKSRYEPLVNKNPRLQTLMRKTDNVRVKMIGDAFAHFLGLMGTTQKLSTPSDTNYYDEVDAVADGLQSIETSMERTAGSAAPELRFFSTPSVAGAGINHFFEMSDQKHLWIKCEHCPTDNILVELKFPECIAPGFLACRHCGKPLNTAAARWVAKHPGRSISGWHLTRLVDPGAGGYKKLLQTYREARFLQNFYNSKLGLPWEDSGSAISAEFVLSLCSDRLMMAAAGEDENITAGIDVGKVFHVVASRPATSGAFLREIIYIGEVDDYPALLQLLGRLNVRKFVIDAEPDPHGTRDLVKKNRWSGWRCHYDKRTGDALWTKDEKGSNEVKVNRTESLDCSQRILRDRAVSLPRRSMAVEDFARHCASIKRTQVANEKTGEIRYEYVQTAADHYRHAWNYDVLAWYSGSETTPEGVLKVPEGFDFSSLVVSGPGGDE